MSADEGGVLGNLPHSRPGTRSEKRTAGTGGAKRAGTRTEKPAGSRTAKPAGGGSQKPTGARRAASGGTRSGKRPATAAARAAEDAERRNAAAASRPRTTRGARQRTARRAAPAAEQGRPRRPNETAPPDSAVGGAVRTVSGIAGAGFKVASVLTRELVRRMPRP
jgi:hypothetical protein